MSVCSFYEVKLHTRVKAFKEVNYKHMVIIIHTKCNTDHLANIGNIGSIQYNSNIGS